MNEDNCSRNCTVSHKQMVAGVFYGLQNRQWLRDCHHHSTELAQRQSTAFQEGNNLSIEGVSTQPVNLESINVGASSWINMKVGIQVWTCKEFQAHSAHSITGSELRLF